MTLSSMSRVAIVAMVSTLAACSDSTSPDRLLAPSPTSLAKTPVPATGGAGGGGGGGGGGGRLEIGVPLGLYIDPAPAGNLASGMGKTVQGYVSVSYGHPSGGNTSFGTPASTRVTLNGVPLGFVPNTNGSTFWVDPAGAQPVVAPGGQLTLIATVPASAGSAAITRTLILPCPPDISVASTPAIGSSLAGVATVHLSGTANLAFNAALSTPSLLNGKTPDAILFGYDASSRAISTQSAEAFINFAFGGGRFDFTVPVGTPAAGNAYLMQMTWPGTYILDGQSGGFCGMTKHWIYTR